MRALLMMALVASALLSGCVVEEDPTANEASSPEEAPALEGQQFEAAPNETVTPVAEDEPAPPHGTPQRTDGPITTGTEPSQVPGAWAQRTVTITNDAYGAALVDLDVAIAAGSILIAPTDGDLYEIVAVLEARAATEAQAQQELERVVLEHVDALEGDVLHLGASIGMREEPAPAPGVPQLVNLDLGSMVRADIRVLVPVQLAYDATAGAASGDITTHGLRGPGFSFSTASGDIELDGLNAGRLEADAASGTVTLTDLLAESLELSTASGDVVAKGLVARSADISTASGSVLIDGAIDSLDASTSSGDLELDLAPQASGAYDLSSASGSIELNLPADGRGYAVEAGTASGDIDVDLADGEVIEAEERHVEAATKGFEGFDVQTVIDASTSSGDIGIESH